MNEDTTAREAMAEELEVLRRRVAELAESEERFRVFFDCSPIGKSMTAPDGRLLRINRAFSDLVGLTLDEMQRISFAEITHPDDLAESKECVRSLLAGERDSWTMEKRYLVKGGGVIWTLVTTRLYRDTSGAPLYFLTHIQDISATKKQELELHERIKELRCLQRISQIVESEGVTSQQILAESVRVLSVSWQYSEGTIARIRVGADVHQTGDLESCVDTLSAQIRISGTPRGVVEIGYVEEHPRESEGPFLSEERDLIEAVAYLLGNALSRLEHEASLARERATLRAVFDGISDMIYVSDPDTHELLHVNEVFRQILGDNVLGKKCHEVIQGRGSPCPFCTDHQIFNENMGKSHTWEYQSPINNRWYKCFDKAIEWVDGRVVRFQQTSDITLFKESEQVLIVSKRELEIRNRITQIFLTTDGDEMYSGVLEVILDAFESEHGTFGYINDEGDFVVPTMTRHIWDQCQVPQKTFAFPCGQWGESIWPKAIRKKRILHSNERSELTPKGHIPVERNIAVPIVFNGEVIGLYQVANKEVDYDERDLELARTLADVIAPILKARLITEREEALRMKAEEEINFTNEALLRSNQELEQFAYVASHDLQEPLRMVSSYTQLLAHRYGDSLDQDAKEFIEFAVDGAKRMQQLIRDLLSYSRVSTRGRPLEPIDANEALGEALSNLATAVAETGAIVTNEELPVVMADVGQVSRLFQNFISNAIKFRRDDEPPRIRVKSEREGDEWIFSVADNGIGIEPDYFERIFVIFQRLHARGHYEGTGIGLAICKRIVERHEGKIWGRVCPWSRHDFLFYP